MATIGAITRKVRSTNVALVAQAARGTFLDPSTAYMAVSNLSLQIATVETPNNEYTGTIEGNAPDLGQGAVTLTYTVNLRGPGGADVPVAGAYLPGILMIAAKMAEVRVATAIPAAPEALSAGTTTGFTGGVGMPGVADAYRGMVVEVGGGTKPKSFAGIRTNTAGKAVTLAKKHGSALSGNYQIPKQLMYQSTLSSVDPMPLSHKVWIGGVRYDLFDLALSSFQINAPTATRNQGSTPTLTVTLIGRLSNYADEATPGIPTLGATAQNRNGQQYLANEQVAGAGFTLESGAQSEAAPDPNSVDGSGTQELVGLNRSLQVQMQGYLKADFDTIALANAQARHGFFSQWGVTSGQVVCVTVADARFGFSSPDTGGNTVTETPNLYIEALNANVTVSFPYFT